MKNSWPNKPTVQTRFFNGREFHRVIWTRNIPENARAVIVVWHIRHKVSPTVFNGSCVSRRVVH